MKFRIVEESKGYFLLFRVGENGKDELVYPYVGCPYFDSAEAAEESSKTFFAQYDGFPKNIKTFTVKESNVNMILDPNNEDNIKEMMENHETYGEALIKLIKKMWSEVDDDFKWNYSNEFFNMSVKK